jgi:hypothetical protein
LELIQQEVSANAISVPSSRGNRTLGHYALVVSPVLYVQAATVQFIAPVAPGAAPIHLAGATAAQITEDNRQYLADQKEFSVYMATEAKLKHLILTAVPTMFTNAIKTSSSVLQT